MTKALRNMTKYDGLAISVFAIIISITGLFYAFDVVPKIIYFASSGSVNKIDYTKDLESNNSNVLPFESVINKIVNTTDLLYPKSSHYNLVLPSLKLTPQTKNIVKIRVIEKTNSYSVEHQLFFDSKNGDLLLNLPYKETIFAEKVLMANYDIHTGMFFGIWSKLLWFFIGLFCAGLYVTGLLLFLKKM